MLVLVQVSLLVVRVVSLLVFVVLVVVLKVMVVLVVVVMVVLVVVMPIGQVREVNYMPSVQQWPRGCSERRFIEMHQGIVQAPCLVHRSH